MLTGGARDLPGRQQTLRGAIDWSYDLLEPPDRCLFERFAIHSGGAYLTQAEAICGPASELGEDVLEGLSSLADKSLVRPDLAAAEDPRFAMLVTIRDYAHERLEGSPEFEDLGRRHAQVYLALCETLSSELTGPAARSVSDRLERDHDNIRAALEWAISRGEAELALRFVAAVWRFWQRRGHIAEARTRIESVLAMPSLVGQPDELLARAYGAAGGVTYWQADTHATYRFYDLALAAAERSGDKRLIARALYDHGFAGEDLGEVSNALYSAGLDYWERSIALYRELDDASGIANSSWGLAQAYAGQGDREKGAAYAQESIGEYRRLGDPFGLGWALFLLAGIKQPLVTTEDVEPLVRESLAIFLAANDLSGILFNLAAFANFAEKRGQRQRALRIGGAAETLRAATGAALFDSPAEMFDFGLPTRPQDDPDAMREWQIGARMSADEVAHYALEDTDSDKTELSAE